MAIQRTVPKCPYCGDVIAKGVYRDQSNIPFMQRLIGDSFIRWDYIKHSCPGKIEADEQSKKDHEKWLKEARESGREIPPFFKQ